MLTQNYYHSAAELVAEEIRDQPLTARVLSLAVVQPIGHVYVAIVTDSEGVSHVVGECSDAGHARAEAREALGRVRGGHHAM